MPNQGEEKKRIARRQIKRVVSLSPADKEIETPKVDETATEVVVPADTAAETPDKKPDAVTEETLDVGGSETENVVTAEAEPIETVEQEPDRAEEVPEMPEEPEKSEVLIGEAETEEASPIKEKNTGDIGGIMRVGGVLLAVCAVVTLLLAVVNFLTAGRIADNKANDINVAVQEIFPKSMTSEEIEYIYEEPVTGVYKVMSENGQLGYAVSVVSTGFGGDMELLIGIAQNGSVAGVRVISHAETPNVGSKATASGYLSGYVGKSGNLVLKSDIDAVSGATISSKAVLEGVNAALALGLKVDEEAADTGSSDITVDTITPIPPDTSLETVPVTGDVPSLKYETLYRDETTAPETEANETSVLEVYTDPVEETTVPGESTGDVETVEPGADATTNSVE